MSGQKNPGHVKKSDRPRDTDEVETRDLEARNEATWRGPGEEPRNVRKAGGGVVGGSLGGAHTGRYGPAPSKVTSNREPKPRGSDKE